MLPCSKLLIIWHCQVKKTDTDKSFKITGNLFFHSSVTAQLLLSYRPYFVASTCPKDDLRRVLQVKIVLVTFTTNNPWRFKYSHDFEAFSWCFRFQTLQLLNFVATCLPKKSEYATWCLNRPAKGSSMLTTMTKDPIPGNHRIALSLDMDLLKRPGQTKRCTQKHKSMVNNSRNGEEIHLPISYQYSLTTWYFSGQSIVGCL